MNYSRIMVVRADEPVTARTQSGGNYTCKQFVCTMLLCEGIDTTDQEPEYRPIEQQFLTVINTTDQDFEVDDLLMVGQDVQENWHPIVSGGGGGSKIFKTPADGIPACPPGDCADMGVAECEPFELNIEEADEEGDCDVVEKCLEGMDSECVYNPFCEDIAGSVTIVATKVKGKWVVVAEDCCEEEVLPQ